jgi:hypothetical protein
MYFFLFNLTLADVCFISTTLPKTCKFIVESSPMWAASHRSLFCSTGIWTQGLHLEPLTSPFLYWVFLREDLMNYLPGWLQTVILLICDSWEARATGMINHCPDYRCLLK